MRAECYFPECVRPVHGQGLCKTHYSQQRRGKPLSKIPEKKMMPARFWQYVDKSGDCWEWIGATRPQGYGTFHLEGRQIYPHRLAYEMAAGAPIPKGMVIDHTCFNRMCVNPSHLRVVSRHINAIHSHRGTRRRSESGFRGVTRNHKKWNARVVHQRQEIHLGSFDTPEEAARAATEKRRELFAHPEYQEEIA